MGPYAVEAVGAFQVIEMCIRDSHKSRNTGSDIVRAHQVVDVEYLPAYKGVGLSLIHSFRLCMGYVNDYGLARDLAQETFVAVWQKLSSDRKSVV